MNTVVSSKKVLESSGISFGTSGARGLVEDFTPQVCAAFTHAFLAAIKSLYSFDSVAIGIDNRPSSEAMANAIASAIESLGYKALYYGVLPTPALAYHAMNNDIPSIMVTGSHIPFDRNGLKFYRPTGEITKADEHAILNQNISFDFKASEPAKLSVQSDAIDSYIERYVSLFDTPILAGKKIGIYEHSSAGRDVYHRIFKQLGAEVTALARSDEFVPIDTEAVSEEDKAKAKLWSEQYGFDSIFSTDGDGDRPLISDENGEWLRGDVLGLITASTANIKALAVPVSCNTAIEKSNFFNRVDRTKIGSPYVIARFDALNKEYDSVAGFEANGGFLLGSDIQINGRLLTALPTRDAVLPAIMLYLASKEVAISDCLSNLPKRFTASDRIKNFATDKSKALIAQYESKPNDLLNLLGFEKNCTSVDTTDGLRMTIEDGCIIHLRPSGNAPELRCYAEAETEDFAVQIVKHTLERVSKL